MIDLLDRYYTPPDVADRLVAAGADSEVSCCIDTACGRGSLLLAAERHFGSVSCIGLDRDAVAVRFLRRARPNWVVSLADSLLSESVGRTSAAHAARSGLLILNPPFSFFARKSVDIQFFGQPLKCSVAMAHILRALELFGGDEGGVAIVPESLVYSQIDGAARNAMNQFFELEIVDELRNSTFTGARANALMIRLKASTVAGKNHRSGRANFKPIRARIVRGGLPVFEAERLRGGLKFVHSTNIASAQAGKWQTMYRVASIDRGVVAGSVLLFPRVGLPGGDQIMPVFLRQRTQLSDCVIAVRFRTKTEASLASERLRGSAAELNRLYRGTGARYVTLETLATALKTIAGVHVEL